MRYQAGIQVILIIISVVIIYMVIKPKFEEIAINQNETAKYYDAVVKVNDYNAKLQELISRANSMPRADRLALNKFLPDSINSTTVARDISNIVKKNGLILLDISAGDLVTVSVNDAGVMQSVDGVIVMEDTLTREARSNLNRQIFTLSAVGSYEQMKVMLSDFERNAYPLRLVRLSFDARADSILHNYTIELETQALKPTN